MSLFQYLMTMLNYSLEQQKHGHPGVVVTRSQAREALGWCSDEYLNEAIYELDNWSDYNKLPSLTCLFRQPVGYGRDLHYFDVHTAFTFLRDLKIQRHFLELKPCDQEIGGKKTWILQVKEGLTSDKLISHEHYFNEDFEIFERELCEKVYSRALATKLQMSMTPEKMKQFLR